MPAAKAARASAKRASAKRTSAKRTSAKRTSAKRTSAKRTSARGKRASATTKRTKGKKRAGLAAGAGPALRIQRLTPEQYGQYARKTLAAHLSKGTAKGVAKGTAKGAFPDITYALLCKEQLSVSDKDIRQADRLYGAMAGGLLCGLLVVKHHRWTAEITHLCSACRGAGRQLLARAEKDARKDKFRVMYLEPLSSATPFYNKMGYWYVGGSMLKYLS
jgi:hypothetical protein